MNEKANVSKVLNAKHRKILEGLLKLPENRECADCKSKAPRWASVNLGIFICMQCSGIHRSLGAHISKVRSATLDTWLPEQVAFVQSMGNAKSNSYWEADLPPDYDRVGMENFIRSKYQDKRWVPKYAKAKSTRVSEEKGSVFGGRPGSGGWQGYTKHIEYSSEERKDSHPLTKNNTINFSGSSVPAPFEVSHQVISDPQRHERMQKLEPVATKAELAKQAAPATPVVTPPKVDYATDLFNLLYPKDSGQNDSETSSANDSEPPELPAAKAKLTAYKDDPSETFERKIPPEYNCQDLFELSQLVTNSSETSQKDSKTDIMNLLEKSTMVPPSSIHQQRLPMQAKQQSFLMAASAKSSGGSQMNPAILHQPGSNCMITPSQNWGSIGHQVPAMLMPATAPKNYMQMRNLQHIHQTWNSAPVPTTSMYMVWPVAPINGMTSTRAIEPPSVTPVPSVTPTQPGKDYDLGSLLQRMFTKQ